MIGNMVVIPESSDVSHQNERTQSTLKRKYRDTISDPSANDLEINEPRAKKMNKVTRARSASSNLSISPRVVYANTRFEAQPSRKPRLVEAINALPLNTFIEQYVPPDVLDRTIRVRCPPNEEDGHQRAGTSDQKREGDVTHEEYAIEIYTASSLPKSYFDACFKLLKSTSAEAYKNSCNGWSPAKKKIEMKLPDMRYMVLVRKRSKTETSEDNKRLLEDGDLGGMLSFMTTYEDGLPVLYCYEVHLAPRLQHQGLGKQFMRIYEDIGRNIALDKAMLTVYKSNESGVKFYERLGFVEDEYSPKPMRLRNGHVKDFDYMILSKPLKHTDQAKHDQTDNGVK